MAKPNKKVKVVLIGGSGYAGFEVIRLLLRHGLRRLLCQQARMHGARHLPRLGQLRLQRRAAACQLGTRAGQLGTRAGQLRARAGQLLLGPRQVALVVLGARQVPLSGAQV